MALALQELRTQGGIAHIRLHGVRGGTDGVDNRGIPGGVVLDEGEGVVLTWIGGETVIVEFGDAYTGEGET